ncbi:PAS domain S-box protein [Pseudonocardia sp.]|uniref:PAS domain S-box protein n=1 Tax=Pseudonocardia sp. TaxID=60912 RepID=UPI0026208EC6|nr:PAS domain S-box protein [Pseudonocardia sp.]
MPDADPPCRGARFDLSGTARRRDGGEIRLELDTPAVPPELELVRELVELHGGKVEVGDSRHGVAFSVRLPAAAEDGLGKARAELARTESAFRLLAEHADDVIGRHSEDGTWLWISPSVRRVAGYRPEDVVGLHPRDVVHPDDAGALTAAFAGLTDDAPAALTLRLRCADGTHRWFALHARRVRDRRTGEVEVHTSKRDVTDQLQAEQELSRFRDLADRAADFIGITSADGTGLYINPAGRELVGLPHDRPVGEIAMIDCIAPADRRRFEGVVAEVEAAGSWAGPMRFVDSAGTVVPVWQAIVVHRDPRGRTAFHSTVAQDLRDRRGGEPALQEERERYRSLVAQAPVGIWVGDRTGAMTFVNDHMTTITGLDLRGLSGVEHIHPDERDAVVASWLRAVGDGADWQHEYRLHDTAGVEHVVTSTARPLRDAAGSITGFLGTTIDVTAQRAAERDRRDAAGEQAARAVSEAAAARLRAMVGGLAAIVWEADWDGAALRFTFVSDRAEELLGYPARRWIEDPSFWPELIHPDDRPAALRYTADRTERGLDHDLTYRACAVDGRVVWLHQVVHVVREPAGGLRAQGLTVDVTEQKRAERSTHILAETGRLLAEPVSAAERLSALARLVVDDFGDGVIVSLSGSDGLLRRIAVAHDDGEVREALAAVGPTRLPPELEAAFSTGRPVEVTGADAHLGVGATGALAVPLQVGGHLAGVLAFLAFGPPRHHDRADLDLVEELGRRASLMLEAERRRDRERHLQQVTADLASADSVADAAALLLPRLRDAVGAGGVSMHLLDPDRSVLRLVHGVGYPPHLHDSYRTIRTDGPVPLGHAARTGTPVWIRDRDDWHRHWPEVVGDALAGRRHAAAALPLLSGGTVVGAIGLNFDTARAFPPDEREFVQALAAQAAPALERAAAADERRALAETLQASLLPPRLPDVDGLAFAARYLPGARGTRAGGDWYDVIPLGGGRVAIVVGDVVGQGARAAAVMGQLRSALSAYLLEGHEPAAAVGHLDRFTHRVPGAAGSTVTCLVLDPATGELGWARAGHLPPLVLGEDGARFLEDAAGTVLAVRGRPPYVGGRAVLGAGDTVVLYTDGLVERRDEIVDAGLERLRGAGDRARDLAPAALAEELLATCLDDGPTDDVALMVARRVPVALALDVPARGEELRPLRVRVAEWACAVGMGEDEAYDLQLALGEAAANVVEHAYPDGPGRLRVDVGHRGDRVVVQVRDDGRWRPPAADPGHRGRGLALIRALAQDVELEPGIGGTAIRFSLPTAPR